jgi:retron-type reverse transcriptase
MSVRLTRSLGRGGGEADMPRLEDRSCAIPGPMVWEAWRRVRANRGAPGVDGRGLEGFEAGLADNRFMIWNRMSSGSCFPPPVRAVEIPRPHGEGVRLLGVPTIADRVARTVVAMHVEQRAEHGFHPDCYGYRPGRSAHQALAAVLEVRLGDRSRRPEVLRWGAVGPRAAGGRGGHRRPLGASVCQAVAGRPARAPRWRP